MANKKDLRGGIEKMREVAQLLNEWADDMESSLIKKSGRKAAADTAPAEAPAAAEAEEPAADEAAVVRKEPEIPAPETVREILGKKCAAGYRAQVQALINSFGAMKFSEVDPAHYPALLEAVGGLGEAPATASGGNIAGGEITRNERSVRGTVATIEGAGPEVDPDAG